MNKLKGIISVIGIVVKYSAVVMAIIKGIEVVYTELDKLDLSDTPILRSDIKKLENE
jgi:hypothetical protein